ncbi:MAG TPA: agmatine deiminase family protein [Rhodanobacteraceae bacterium]|nr:agmatine deiminase family protein [Rhodanobacteraceae bacterium]
MTAAHFRLPAEWEPQAAVLLAWPHSDTDWGPRLLAAESSYVALVTAIARFERALVCVPDPAVRERAADLLSSVGADLSRIGFIEIPYDDTWLRDSGPMTLKSETGHPAAARTRRVRHMSGLAFDEPDKQQSDSSSAHPCAENEEFQFCLADFRFTGWGGKFEGSRDDALVAGLLQRDVFHAGTGCARYDWALEGGAIESDGRGTILTTWRCLHQRHPEQSREEMSRQLCESLGARRVLWLDRGYLQGDDTDAHIDTLARFAPDGAIVFQACDDPADPHFAELAAMREELAALRTPEGRPYTLHALPWAQPIVDEGRRLAASYANYLIVNGGVLVPAYGDPADATAARIIAAAHPGREVVQIPCRPLIWQNGSLHCVTMQLPEGVVAS